MLGFFYIVVRKTLVDTPDKLSMTSLLEPNNCSTVMFDLKAKLLAKGLVTKEQVDKVTTQDRPKRSPDLAKSDENFLTRERNKVLANLKAQTKAEQYITIRKWVDINRVDKQAYGLDDSEKFFFNTQDNQVTWLTLKKSVVEDIRRGRAGVIAYMSNHGLTHAVVPRDIAEDVGEVFLEWLRVLNEREGG
jgi:hypothetical protein